MRALSIKAAGMVTAVGFNERATCAALRAGVRNVNRTNLWDPETGTYLAAGRVALPQWGVGVSKLADLVTPAILECLDAARPVPASEIPLLLGVPSSNRPARMPDLETELVAEIEHRLGFRLHPASRLIAADRVAIAVGLRYAAEVLERREAACVVVAGVDSLVEHRLKDHYLNERRLLTPRNSNGFSLGEAGSAVLVADTGTGSGGELEIRGIGIADEPATIESDRPLRAEGLTEAIRAAFHEADVDAQATHYRIADLNGEHYRFKEMTLAMGRFPRRPTAKLFDVWHPIEHIGDVGAAIGPLVLGWARHAALHGYANGPTVLCTLANDTGERAAIVAHHRRESVRR